MKLVRPAVALLAVALLTVGLAGCRPADRYARRVPTGVGPAHHVFFRTFGELTKQGAAEGAKPIALTFDDGPGPNTLRILAILQKAKIPATFFMVGRQVKGNEDIVRKVVASGSRVGAHSFTHANLLKLSGDELRHEIDWPLNVLGPLMPPGDPITCFRPPYGNADTEVRDLLGERHLAEANWSVDPEDWRAPGADVIADRVVSHAFAGAVVLLHDGGKHPQTVEALPQIILRLAAAGYSFVSLC